MSFGTLKGWVQHAKTQPLVDVLPAEKRPEDWTPSARLLALQQSHGLEEKPYRHGVASKVFFHIPCSNGEMHSVSH